MEWLSQWWNTNLHTQSANTQQQAAYLLHKADVLDKYRTVCEADWMNKTARQGQIYRPWPDQSFAQEVETLEPSIRCIIMEPSADGGMPHTRAPNIICIPVYYPRENLKTLLRHEMTHIQQRQNPEKWIQIVEKEGWMQVEETDIPVEYRRRCRFNPDTLYARWMAWEGRYVPLPLFLREDTPRLRDVSIRWWDMREQHLLSTPPLSYQRRYGNTVSAAAQEHPFELLAYRAEHNK
jgi:hypothetical protein